MNRFSRNTAASLLTAIMLMPPALFAQQTPPPAEESQKLVETIDVRVINVDVVVTDKKGNVITGLTKDDFELYENNVPKPISNFYEVAGSKSVNVVETPAPAPATTSTAPPSATAIPAPEVRRDEIPENLRRRIIFYIDNLSLAPFNRNKVFAQMKDFVKNVMRPGDEAMVATFNRSMKVRVPFTRDAVQINQTLDAIAGESAMGLTNTNERKDVESQIRDAQSYDDALADARTYAESVTHDLRQSVESLNALMTTLAGVDGKKILVLTSEGFPISPGKEAFYYIEEEAKEKQGWQSGGTLLEGMGFDSTPLIQSIARTANANGITMYTIHAGGLDSTNDNSAENSRPTSFTVSQAVISNSTDSMMMMAEMTGGLASIQTNDFKKAFTRIQKDLESYYSLGYRAGTERVDRQRELDVRVKNRNYIVRARQTFVEKSPFAEMSDRVIANLLYRTKSSDMKVLVKTNTPIATDDPDFFRVPVEVQIPMEGLTLIPQGDEFYAGGFDVYVVVANKDNDLSDVARKTHQLRVPTADIGKIKGKYYTYTLELLMEKGLNKLSVGVADQISNVSGFARDQVIAQDLR